MVTIMSSSAAYASASASSRARTVAGVPTMARRWRPNVSGSTETLGRHRRAIVGTPATVRARLEALAEAYAADELMIVTITHDHQARRRSYELIADVFG